METPLLLHGTMDPVAQELAALLQDMQVRVAQLALPDGGRAARMFMSPLPGRHTTRQCHHTR